MKTRTRWMVPALVIVAAASAQAKSSKLDKKTTAALHEALADERKAQDIYAAVMERHGEVRPFSNIIEAERRHERELVLLFDSYDMKPSPREAPAEIEVPDTLAASCKMAIEAENRNIAMYDGFLEFVKQADIRDTFTRLRNASRDRHLPAFKRCASNKRGPRRGKRR
jgi:rubrerythrin